jgi:hypothetical protein
MRTEKNRSEEWIFYKQISINKNRNNYSDHSKTQHPNTGHIWKPNIVVSGF